MNAITQTRRIDAPEAGFFKLRLVKRGPWVAAAIDHRLGFWSASISGVGCGARHPDPAHAAGLERVWTTGTRIDATEYAALLANPPLNPTLAIDLGSMQPVSFEEPRMNAIAGIGHNNPPQIDLAAALEPKALASWIAGKLEPHVARANLLTASYGRFLIATANGIANDDVDGRAVDFAEQIREEIVATDATRVKIKAPVLAAQKAIDGAAKAISDALLPARQEVQARHTAYLVAKDREARRIAAEEAARQQAIAQQAAEEAARKEAEVQRLLDEAAETGDDEAMEQAIVASTEHEAAVAQHEAAVAQHEAAAATYAAPTADLTRMRTTNGTISGLKDNWVWAVEDEALIPAALMMPNAKLIDAAVKAGKRSIPGLRITNQPKASIR